MRRFNRFEEGLKERYDRLYGGKECSSKIEKNRRRLLMKCVAAAMLLCIVAAVDLMAGAGDLNGVKIGSEGRILEIKRPPQEGEAVSFGAEVEIKGKDGSAMRDYYITIEPVGEDKEKTEEIRPEKSREEKTEEELRSLISGINADTTNQKVKLPVRLESGELLIWRKTNESNLPLYFAAVIAAAAMIYRMRFSEIEREEKEAVEVIVRDLPEFINKIVLLLNAGVVLNTAFLKTIEDHGKTGRRPDYFYGQLQQISRSVQEANGSLHQEFRQFAKRSRVKELMRVANIISDNISKGADLAGKLKKENELLWFSRKQQSEEKGRLAETKLTMPLVILLLVLIMITIAPALMGM